MSFLCVATARTMVHASARVPRRDNHDASASAGAPHKTTDPPPRVPKQHSCSRRAWTTGLSLGLAVAPPSTAPLAAFAADPKPETSREGITRVVMKTASILPEVAAEFLVTALGLRLLTAEEDPAVGRGRVVVKGAWGMVLELRGGGDTNDLEAGEIAERNGMDAAPRVTTVTIASANPAKSRNDARRNGATLVSRNSGPAVGERCSGDAFAGCAVNLVGLDIVFVKTSVLKGVPAVVRVGLTSQGDAATVGLTQKLAPALAVQSDQKKGQPGVTERAAEDRFVDFGETLLVPSTAGQGGGLSIGGAWVGSAAWRVVAVASETTTVAP